MIDHELAAKKFTSECTPSYVATIRHFINDHIVGRLAHSRKHREAYDASIIDNTSKVTENQLQTFLQLCWVKYVKARIEPGTPVFTIRGGPDPYLPYSSRFDCWRCWRSVYW